MLVLFDESGEFKIGYVLSNHQNTLQIEYLSGKRGKIKQSHVIFQFEHPSPDTLLTKAEAQTHELDIKFLWECAPSEDFNVQDFAADVYGDQVTIVDKISLLLCLHGSPIYFHRKGKGLYKAAPKEILEAALASLERKRQQQEQTEQWSKEIISGHLPAEIALMAPLFLIQPDKNSLPWKAFEKAQQELGISTAELLFKLGVYPSELALHRANFFQRYFPKGTQITELAIPTHPELPKSEALAYSIDDMNTTEIDDALSVQNLGENRYLIGIHIAAPALAVTKDSPLDLAARQRMSTVYLPGQKIPMQQDSLILRYSLNEGDYRDALSLYATVDLNKKEILNLETKLNQVMIAKNLRIHEIDKALSLECLEDENASIPYPELFRPLWQFTKMHKAQREAYRGKPENNSRVEFNFDLDGKPDDPDATVRLIPRHRDAPLDLIVAEMMLFTNSQWAKQLNELNLPAIFRCQQTGRTRMTTYAHPHETIGVEQYAWCTSPLRRYVDLVNQQQLICAAEYGISSPLVAPYKPKDKNLFTLITEFESIYSAWSEIQQKLERYWALRWLQQNKIDRCQAEVVRDKLIRLTCAPIITPLDSLPSLDKGSLINVNIRSIDLLNLNIELSYGGIDE